MREPLRDRERLQHMIEAINRISRYIHGHTHEDLMADDMMYYAVVKNIEIIGEAANMLSNQFIESHKEVPWKMIRGMRNYIVHEYFQIDDTVVWSVVNSDLPQLKQKLKQYIDETNWQQWEEQNPMSGI